MTVRESPQRVPPLPREEESVRRKGGEASVLLRAAQALAVGMARHWLLMVNLFIVLYLGGAYLTPFLMNAGFERPARLLYTVYGFTCHQLPQRSYFFGGQKGVFFGSYSKEELVAQGADPTSDLTMRRFVGNSQIGYKAAIAHRLSGLYTGALAAGLLFALVRRRWRVQPMPLWALALFVIPMAVDGTSHLINDVTGWGFRDTNAWAVTLTGGIFPPDFYAGTTVGTLNWLLRTVTGFLFGFGMIWFVCPYLELGFQDVLDEVARKETALEQEGTP